MTHDALKALEGGDLDALLCLFETAKGEPFKPTATQRDIIRSIILKERRLAVNCMTRYGKSYCISIAIILLSMLVKGNRTVIVAPTVNHTDILMRYVAANIGKHSHPMIRDMIVDSQVRGKRGLSNEVSRKRITFKNGSEIYILPADIHNDGRALIGWGADTVIVDECEQIPERIVRSLIMRMLGDDPEHSSCVLISNPSSHGFMYSQVGMETPNPLWKHIRVDHRTALREGRVTEAHIREMRHNMSDYEFKVYYESVWPESLDDQLIPTWAVFEAVDQAACDEYRKHRVEQFDNTILKFAPRSSMKRRLLGVDVATSGADIAAFSFVDELADGSYIQWRLEEIDKIDAMELAAIISSYNDKYHFTTIYIDATGIGNPIYSALCDFYHLNDVLVPVVAGAACVFRDSVQSFADKTSQNYWALKRIFETKKIKIQDHVRLTRNLRGFGIDTRVLPRKIKVLRPREREKTNHVNVDDKMISPDFSDSLALVFTPVVQDSDLAVSMTNAFGINGGDTDVYYGGW